MAAANDGSRAMSPGSMRSTWMLHCGPLAFSAGEGAAALCAAATAEIAQTSNDSALILFTFHLRSSGRSGRSRWRGYVGALGHQRLLERVPPAPRKTKHSGVVG